MADVKVVVTGPVGSGKTTFVHSLTGDGVITTDEMVTNGLEKEETTVALDHGQVTIEGREMALFGTPGQERFDYMWEMLADGTDAVVLLIPADRAEAVAKADRILKHVMADRSIPLVAAITRSDLANGEAPSGVSDQLGATVGAVTPIDAREADECATVLRTLVDHVEA